MKYKFIMTATLLTLSLTSIALANRPPKPAKCPAVSSIASVGVDTVVPNADFPNAWDVYNKSSKYDTKVDWMLGVMDTVHATSAEQATAYINAGLTTLTYESGPVPNEVGWACFYTGKAGQDDITVLTITPPQTIPTLRLMKR
jgi:hypothetical protein